jgi:hypothetical protein
MRIVVIVAVLGWLIPATVMAQTIDMHDSGAQPLGVRTTGAFSPDPPFPPSGATTQRTIHAPDLAARLAAESRSRSHWRTGAIAGFVIGAGATYLVLHSGGSTATCDRERNQDAIGARECAAATVGGGLVGAGLGAIIGSQIRVRR